MWRELWQKWTIDKPAAVGDWLWDVFVVRLAALLDRLTPRKVIALVPLVILIVAYAHRIALPPEVALLGDVVAYIDIVSVLLLLSVLSRAATIFFIVKEAAASAAGFISGLVERTQRVDFRHRRNGANKRKQLIGRTTDDDDLLAEGVAWA
jgi:hypothetical protein